MRYLLNSAVVTSPGLYIYRLATVEQAKAWHARGPVVSTIGYQQTADALTELLGVPVMVNRVAIAMQPHDEALVFRLSLPPGTERIDPADKGRLSDAIMAGHYELGILCSLPEEEFTGQLP